LFHSAVQAAYDVKYEIYDLGIAKIIVTGGNSESCREALRLSRLYPDYLFFTAGLNSEKNIIFLFNSLMQEIQECIHIMPKNFRLMYSRKLNILPKSRSAWLSVKLACRIKKPLFVHERDAHEQLKEVLVKYKADLPDIVIHCFTGTADEAKTYLDLGFYIGLTGFLWKDRTEDGVQYALRNGLFPMERLMVETDAPFMFPNIQAKKLPEDIKDRLSDHARQYLLKYCSFHRNEPCSLPAVTELVAAFMNVPVGELAFATTRNAVQVFGLTTRL
uniref:Deoxyribonuclease TATDN1 n=1 Tax=Soboliphyme baturini TaxID=241478 RepID=A0A183IIS3_9BILA